MNPTFPCPNPACTHTFSPQAIQGASRLVCPKCGTAFRFASGAATPARSTSAKKPAPPPLPKANRPPTPPPLPPIAPAPIAQPVAGPVADTDPAANFDFDSSSDPAAPPARRSPRPRVLRRLAGWLAALVAIALGLTGAVWGGLWLRHLLNKNVAVEESTSAASGFNARFILPGKPWTRDKDLQMRLHVHIGMKSSEHNSGMALLFKDYRDRLPSDAEMIDEAVGKLRFYFRGLEWELRSKDEQAQLAEHPAKVLQFQGEDAEQVTMNGECTMMAFRGFGYWFFTWAPLSELENDREAIQAEWERLRQRLSLQEERKGWKAKPRQTEMLAGKKAKYRLAYVKGLWTREAGEGDEPEVDFLLRGQEPDPEHRPLASKDATVQGLVLSRQSDLKSATAAALAHVKQREMKLYERAAWEPIKDKNGEVDRDANIGAEAGHLSKLHVKCTEDLERYLSIAVVNRPEGVVVLVGDCLWERRDFWDQEFMALFNSFKAQ